VDVPDDRNRQFFERAIGLALIASLVAACLSVTAPFIIPLLWGVIIAVSTWPVYRRLRDALGGYRKLAATIMAILLTLILVAPIVLLSVTLADNVQAIVGLVGGIGHYRLPPPPPWVRTMPLIGPRAYEYWREAMLNMGAIFERAQPYIASLTTWLLARGADLGLAMLEFLVAIVIAGVLYVTGEPGVAILRRFIRRIASEREVALVDIAGRTIRGVAIGVIGTAFVQGVIAAIGLMIVSAPGPVLLGFTTFVVSVAQLPTALVLLPVAGWLFWSDMTWQAVFLAVWCVAVVNMVDNVVRPILISHGARLPFILITIGVLGGLLTWGFIGIFLGATLLAVSYTLFRNWLDDDRYVQAWPSVIAGTAAERVEALEERQR
jgi:predicted PurR-regulated permease PerM